MTALIDAIKRTFRIRVRPPQMCLPDLIFLMGHWCQSNQLRNLTLNFPSPNKEITSAVCSPILPSLKLILIWFFLLVYPKFLKSLIFFISFFKNVRWVSMLWTICSLSSFLRCDFSFFIASANTFQHSVSSYKSKRYFSLLNPRIHPFSVFW